MSNYILTPDGVHIDIPGIKSINTSYEDLTEKFRTIGGYLKCVGVGSKVALEISTTPMDKYSMLSIKGYLQTMSGFTHTLYLDELNAYIECDIVYSDTKVLIGSDMYEVTLSIKEV